VTRQRERERERTSQLQAARLLASIVESSDDAIISKSLDGTIQTWNAGAERVFGFTAEEAVGRHISIVIPPDRIAEEDLIIARLRAGDSERQAAAPRAARHSTRLDSHVLPPPVGFPVAPSPVFLLGGPGLAASDFRAVGSPLPEPHACVHVASFCLPCD